MPTTLTINTSLKTCKQVGLPGIRNTEAFTLLGLTGTSAGNLRLALIADGRNLATCNSFSVGGGGYVGDVNMNTIQLVQFFGTRRGRTIRQIRVLVQDIIQDLTYLNDEVDVLDNPYEEGMDEPTEVDPIGGTEYAPLDGYLAHVGDTGIHVTAEEKAGWSDDIDDLQADLTAHTGNADIHVTAGDKDYWDGAVEELDAHTANSGIHVTSGEKAKLALIQDAPVTSLLVDNQANYFVLGLSASYRSFLVDFAVEDTINCIQGSLAVGHIGGVAFVTPLGYGAYPADITGVTWDADINSGNVRLKVTLASVGGALRFGYGIKSKIPVYS